MLPPDIKGASLKVGLPTEAAVPLVSEFSQFFMHRKQLQVHSLPDSILIVMDVDCTREDDLVTLDKLTSTVVMYGGTVQPSSRKVLDQISPYLAKRMIGHYNLPLQEKIKAACDPNLVLEGDSHMFLIRKQNRKSVLQQLREEKKIVNFYLNKFGL